MIEKIHIPLSEFVKGRTQKEVAEFMGRTQGSVNQMLTAEREVYIVPDAPAGEPRWFEIVKPRKTSTQNRVMEDDDAA